MTYRLSLFGLLCALIISCTSDQKTKFEHIVLSIDRYFTEKPAILTSKRITQDNKKIYCYYALKVIDYNLSYHITRSSYSTTRYRGIVKIVFNAQDNSNSGDLISDISEFQTVLDITPEEPSCFSTTNMALANANFSSDAKCTIQIRYSYQGDKWVYDDLAGGPTSESFVHDLESFSHNKKFREAIGMGG